MSIKSEWVNDDRYEDMEHFLLREMNKIHYTISCTIADLDDACIP